jgi:hypothetical protein
VGSCVTGLLSGGALTKAGMKDGDKILSEEDVKEIEAEYERKKSSFYGGGLAARG